MTSSSWAHVCIIPLLPALGAALNGLLGRRFPKTVVNAIALGSTGLSFLWALRVVSGFFSNGSQPIAEHYGTWIRAGAFAANFGFYVDQLSVIMLLVVTGVGFLIHIY